jgi:hypothetical protein
MRTDSAFLSLFARLSLVQMPDIMKPHLPSMLPGLVALPGQIWEGSLQLFPAFVGHFSHFPSLAGNDFLFLSSGTFGYIKKPWVIMGDTAQVLCHFPCAVNSLCWSQDGATLFFLAPVARNSQSSYAVYAVPAQGGEPARIACGENNCAREIRALQQTPLLAVMVGEGLESRLDLLDSQNGEMMTLLSGMDGERSVEYASWDVKQQEDSTCIVAVVRSAGNQQWEVWAGPRQQEQKNKGIIIQQQLSFHQKQLADIAFGPQEPFFWTASDGLET